MATFGPIVGVKVGATFSDRQECFNRGVHRLLEAGIHGDAELGAFSIVMSGKYPDKDFGDSIVYIGEGGWRTAPDGTRYQAADQEETSGNLALIKSYETQKLVRVIRGSRLKSDFAPISGFRYDGLYKVTKYDYHIPQDHIFQRYEFWLERVDKTTAIPIRVLLESKKQVKAESSQNPGDEGNDHVSGSSQTRRRTLANPFTSKLFRKVFQKVLERGSLFANRRDAREGPTNVNMPSSAGSNSRR